MSGVQTQIQIQTQDDDRTQDQKDEQEQEQEAAARASLPFTLHYTALPDGEQVSGYLSVYPQARLWGQDKASLVAAVSLIYASYLRVAQALAAGSDEAIPLAAAIMDVRVEGDLDARDAQGDLVVRWDHLKGFALYVADLHGLAAWLHTLRACARLQAQTPAQTSAPVGV